MIRHFDHPALSGSVPRGVALRHTLRLALLYFKYQEFSHKTMVLLRSKRVPYALSVARSVTEQLTAPCYLGVMEHLRSHGNNCVSIIRPPPIKPISVSFPFQRHCPSATNRIHQYASRRCNESVSSTYRKSSLLFVSFLSSCLISACWIQERNIWISE